MSSLRLNLPRGPLDVSDEGLDDDAVVLPCAHAFHGRCLRPWFALAYSDALRAGEAPTLACPVCRSVLPEGEPEA